MPLTVTENRPINVLLMGDPHAHPDYDNDRFEMAGEFVLENKVDAVVCIGDWADMPSLSSYDKGKRGFEGRRYVRDVEAAIDALQRFNKPMDKYNKQQRKNKKAQYLPSMYMLGGNHDQERISRVTQDSAELHELMDYKDLQYKEHGWECVDFKDNLILNGTAFSHYFASGVMGRPIGGERPALQLINKMHMSSVTGHNHLLDFAMRTRPDGTRVIGVSAGCFVHPGYVDGWCKNTRKLWWEGLIHLRGMQNGEFSWNTITTQELYNEYK